MTDLIGGSDSLGNKSGRPGSLLGNSGVCESQKVASAVDTILRTRIKRQFIVFQSDYPVCRCLKQPGVLLMQIFLM